MSRVGSILTSSNPPVLSLPFTLLVGNSLGSYFGRAESSTCRTLLAKVVAVNGF
jgi:hypothetical protein